MYGHCFRFRVKFYFTHKEGDQNSFLSLKKHSLSYKDAEKRTHAFISNRLDYCTALFTGLSKQPIEKFQLIQNCAVKIFDQNKEERAYYSGFSYTLQARSFF